jgi:hypothetical protein
MRNSPIFYLVFTGCSLFATSPATHSPLRERLATADTSTVEEAARACLAKGGWKVDPVGGLAEGANVVSASKAKDQTDLYIQAPEVKPRVTGGPDYDDPFWKCLGGELAGGHAAPATSSSSEPVP